MTTLSLPGWAGQAAYTRSLQRSRGNPVLNRPGFTGNTGVTSTGQVSQGSGSLGQSFNTGAPVQTTSLKPGDVRGPALNQRLIAVQDTSSPPGAWGPGSNPDFSIPRGPAGGWNVDFGLDTIPRQYPGMGRPMPPYFQGMHPPGATLPPSGTESAGYMDAGGNGGWADGTGYFSPQGNYYTFSSPNGWWIGPSGYPAAIQANNNPSGMPGFFGGGSAHSGSFYGPLGGNVSAGSWNTVGGLPWARGQAQF